ncbi:MAG TPA: hypothetical protein PK668_09260 [Myxococcota bacterium]|nr:hypothetical protein [Myxococcota bacterium]HRY92831.1 hypothetical protein [Myxococcota bacterium]HSA20276.1 hypothetical protein [Myxococcota bacterium]
MGCQARLVCLLATAVAGAALGLACDPLVDEGYRGEPLFAFRGRVVSYEGTLPGGELKVSLFWSPSGQSQVPVEELREQASASVSVDFPSVFEIRVFYPPGAEDLVAADPPWGLALILVYQDRDGNGRFTPGASPSELVGGAEDRVLLYAPAPLPKEQSPTGAPLERGFSLAAVPLDCGGDYQGVQGTEECGVPLGAACAADGDCGAQGVCLLELGAYALQRGMCAMRLTELGCQPLGGTGISLGEVVWIRPCASSLQCPRTGYSCVDLDPSGSLSCLTCWPDGVAVPRGQCYAYLNYAGDPACGQTLGNSCGADEDCAHPLDEGLCLAEIGDAAMPGGYCTLAEPYWGCQPRDARYLMVFRDYWLPSCLSDLDCRVEDGQVCDSFFRICLPDEPTLLSLRPAFSVERDLQPLCYESR